MNGQDSRLFYIYGYRGADQYFVTTEISEAAAIASAKGVTRYRHVEVHDVRENRVVWRRG